MSFQMIQNGPDLFGAVLFFFALVSFIGGPPLGALAGGLIAATTVHVSALRGAAAGFISHGIAGFVGVGAAAILIATYENCTSDDCAELLFYALMTVLVISHVIALASTFIIIQRHNRFFT